MQDEVGAPRETFDKEYVRGLRRQSANYRRRVKDLEVEILRLERENRALQKSKDKMAERLERALETNKKLLEEA